MAATDRAYALIDCSAVTHMYNASQATRTWRAMVKRLLASVAFRCTGAIFLVVAIFGGPLCMMLDVPDDPWNDIVDAVMLSVMFFFTAEVVLRCAVDFEDYALSFLFWMDVLGTASLTFEISFLFGAAGKMGTAETGVGAPSLVTARAARIGARAARLATPVRMLSMIYLGQRAIPSRTPDASGCARAVGERVTQTLSAKAALTAVVLILGVPLLNVGRFPEDDLSLRMSGRQLEADYARACLWTSNATAARGAREPAPTGRFQASVEDVTSFYADLSYFPYRLAGYPEDVAVNGRSVQVPGAALVACAPPARRQNVLEQRVTRCDLVRPGCDERRRAAMYFDFTEVGRRAAALDMCVTLLMIFVMGLQAWEVRRTLKRLVVAPMEQLLRAADGMIAVSKQASRRLSTSPTHGDRGSEDEEESGAEEDELDLFERVFKGMSGLAILALELNVVDEANIRAVDADSKRAFLEMLQYSSIDAKSTTSRGSHDSLGGLSSVDYCSAQGLSGLSVAPEEIQSWSLDLLRMRPAERQSVVRWLMFDSHLGLHSCRPIVDAHIFHNFLRRVQLGYMDIPYHSFAHACDVLCSTFRILSQVQSEEWLPAVDTVALLVSALCHDIGHPGKTNQFLVETGDILSLRYNDKSPLENMHCARLFEMCSDAKANVFAKLDRANHKQARAVCIEGILFTDNAKHFDLVKEVKSAQETKCEEFGGKLASQDTLSSEYIQGVISKDTMLWIKVILHTADVSNPLKTFEMNKSWAMLVVEEAFAQGDEEKRLGLPVGMLNDRDKVNRSGAEHGFINYLLAPLMTTVVKVFPTLHPRAAQMASNMADWHRHWISESSPPEEDIKRREADVDKVREQVQQLSTLGQVCVE